MATAEQAKNRYIRKNISRGIRTVTAAEFIAQFDVATRNALLAAAKKGRQKVVYDLVRGAVVKAASVNLAAEADATLADGQISLDELDGYL